jgi:hypothetical protein
MKGLPTAALSSPFKMIIIIVDGIVYFLEVPVKGEKVETLVGVLNPSSLIVTGFSAKQYSD